MGKAQLYYNDNRQNHNSGDYNCYKCCDLGSFVLTCIVLVQNKKTTTWNQGFSSFNKNVPECENDPSAKLQNELNICRIRKLLFVCIYLASNA